MQRRPWPLVILALVQFLTPLTSLLLSAYLNHVTFSQMSMIIWHTSNVVERFQFFLAPLFVGGLIWYARTWGFFVVIVYGLLVSFMNFQEWKDANQPVSVGILVLVNFFAIALVMYLCIPKVRAIFFNSRLRWWETKPRYIVNLPGEIKVVSEIEEHTPLPCTVIDLSLGGGGLDSSDEFTLGETATVGFQFNDETFHLKGQIVYGRKIATSFRFGVEWEFDSAETKHKYKELISYFRRQKFAETRKPPEWRTDFKGWLERAKKSPSAWVPEVNVQRPPKND